MGPLFEEIEALSEFIILTERIALRACLPEIVSIEEGLLIADAEYRLADAAKDRLAGLLGVEGDAPELDADGLAAMEELRKLFKSERAS